MQGDAKAIAELNAALKSELMAIVQSNRRKRWL